MADRIEKQGEERKYRILVADLAFIGDILMSTPALTNLRKAYPRALIDILVTENSRPMVRHNPDVDRVYTTDLKRKGWKGLKAEAERVKSEGYDLAISLHRGHGTLLMLKMAEVPRRIGFTNGGREWFLTDGIPFEIRKHRSWNHMRLLEEGLGIEVDYETPTRLEMDFEAVNSLDRMLKKKMALKRIVTVNPNAAWPTKRWTPEGFAKVGDALSEEGFQVVLVGSPKEKPICEKVRSLMNRKAIDLTGETTLFELAALLARSEVVVTNDSGPMHMANAVGAKVVGIFGPTEPARCGPWKSEGEVIQAKVDCGGCYLKRCWHHSCMRKVSIDNVIKRVFNSIGNG